MLDAEIRGSVVGQLWRYSQWTVVLLFLVAGACTSETGANAAEASEHKGYRSPLVQAYVEPIVDREAFLIAAKEALAELASSESSGRRLNHTCDRVETELTYLLRSSQGNQYAYAQSIGVQSYGSSQALNVGLALCYALSGRLRAEDRLVEGHAPRWEDLRRYAQESRSGTHPIYSHFQNLLSGKQAIDISASFSRTRDASDFDWSSRPPLMVHFVKEGLLTVTALRAFGPPLGLPFDATTSSAPLATRPCDDAASGYFLEVIPVCSTSIVAMDGLANRELSASDATCTGIDISRHEGATHIRGMRGYSNSREETRRFLRVISVDDRAVVLKYASAKPLPTQLSEIDEALDGRALSSASDYDRYFGGLSLETGKETHDWHPYLHAQRIDMLWNAWEGAPRLRHPAWAPHAAP